MAPQGVVLLLLVASMMQSGVQGHGRLMEPPARNAMWRFGYPNPVNYNDNELYCGGFVIHYQTNNGQCGVCGDDFRDKVPRKHEAGGMFGNGIVGKRYVAGQVIDIEAELTTNHWGYMELRLCPHNDPRNIITQACLDQYVLPLEGTTETKFIIPKDSKKAEIFKWRVKLPDGITCTNCVIQWKYFAGNTWGIDETSGSAAVGYGDQETFINCADVAINTNVPTGAFPPGAVIDNPWQLYFRESFPGVKKVEQSVRPDGLTPLVIRSQLCIPVGHFMRLNYMHHWCMTNCLRYPPNCDPKYCHCVHECEAVGEFKKQKFADHYCHQECLGFPSYCDSKLCRCF